jgi:hypothetical protein
MTAGLNGNFKANNSFMNNVATFKVRRKELLDVLSKFKKLEKTSRKKTSTLEITIIDGRLRLIIPGVELLISATTTRAAKFTMSLLYFAEIAKTESDDILNFTLEEGELKLRGFAWRVPTTFFENDRILRSISLPMNYTHLDIARLWVSDKYTTEEIEFNNLTSDVIEGINKLKADIDRTSSILRKYGFTRNEVQQIFSEKLKIV